MSQLLTHKGTHTQHMYEDERTLQQQTLKNLCRIMAVFQKATGAGFKDTNINSTKPTLSLLVSSTGLTDRMSATDQQQEAFVAEYLIIILCVSFFCCAQKHVQLWKAPRHKCLLKVTCVNMWMHLFLFFQQTPDEPFSETRRLLWWMYCLFKSSFYSLFGEIE